MKKSFKRTAVVLITATSLGQPALAQQMAPFPITPPKGETDAGGIPRPTPGNNNSGNQTSGRPAQGNNNTNNGNKMGVAKVPEAYSCPLFENRPHAELLAAIDSLTKEVKASPECNGIESARAISQNGEKLQKEIQGLNAILAISDPNMVNVANIDQSVTAALNAVGNLGDIFNNSNFLNSACGRQTMSTGKVLLALNDVINGLAPYALFAVSMNAALAPALPFVIGGVIATSGISAITKMIDSNTLDMTNPDHRKALLQNTCQYTKVAKKVRFMQLAQSGKISQITSELESSVDLYNARFAKPSKELTSLLNYRTTKTSAISKIETQLASDKNDIQLMENQLSAYNDDVIICTLVNELVNWAQDGKTFPSSAFVNLQSATAQGDRNQKLQATTLMALHTNSMKQIGEYAQKAYSSSSAVKSCAQVGRSWLTGTRQAVVATENIVLQNKTELENELLRNTEYRQWKAQYVALEQEKLTIERVEKAMKELAKDTSIIDRSELAQRMTILKRGLFGSRSTFSFGKPPVLAWIDHTKKMHDQSISAFIIGMKSLRQSSYSLTPAGQGKAVVVTNTGHVYTDLKLEQQSYETSQSLGNFDQKHIPVGSRQHDITCQNLENAWLDWSNALDHLGAVQFFCDMVDEVLDVKMDKSVMSSCRGDKQLGGQGFKDSLVAEARKVLVRKGYQSEAALINSKMKALECPLPPVSVMQE